MDTYQILIIGPGGSGKSLGTISLLEILNILGFQTSEVKPWTESMVTTSSFIIHNFRVPKNYFKNIDKDINVAIYDLGGQFKYKEMWDMHAEDTDGLVAVVDLTRKTTLRQITLMLPKGVFKNVPIRLIVNKADLYSYFSENIPNLITDIEYKIKQTLNYGFVKYTIKYRGDNKFIFNSNPYQYGDNIEVLREVYFENNHKCIRITDFESLISHSFSQVMDKITEHNSNLLGREFTLLLLNSLYSDTNSNILDDELLISAHKEAPPFLSWGTDPEISIPLSKIDVFIIKETINNMLINEDQLWEMVKTLKENGYNIDIDNNRGWALTSAKLTSEDEDLPYKPMHKAILPPFFIESIISYRNNKSSMEEDTDFFV